MTFVDPGADYAPPPGHLHLTIHPKPPTPSKVQDSLDDLADWAPPESKAARGAGAAAQDPLDMLADWKPPEIKRQVPTGEALGKGVMQGATFGLGPAIEGLGAATGESKVPAFNPNYPGEEIYDVGQSFRGAMKLLDEQLIQPLMTGDKPKQEVLDAFRRGREAAHKDYDLADEQHPGTCLAGQMFGSLDTPGFGAARAGTLMARAGYGFLGGAVGGGLYGAGQGVSAGEGVGDIAKRVGYGAGLGGLGGASVGAAIGPRVVNPLSPGQRAKATAEGLGAPIPRG